MNVTITYEVTPEQLDDMLTCWLEGAPAEDCGFRYVRYETKPEDENMYTGEIIVKRLLAKEKVEFLDPESDWKWDDDKLNKGMHWSWEFQGHQPVGGEWKTLTIRKFLKGIEMYLNNDVCNGCKSVQSIIDDGDWTDVDAILQYAMYGDLIYG